jgi:hypothetical protein
MSEFCQRLLHFLQTAAARAIELLPDQTPNQRRFAI